MQRHLLIVHIALCTGWRSQAHGGRGKISIGGLVQALHDAL